MAPETYHKLLSEASLLLGEARRAGAGEADVVVVQRAALSVSYRLGKLEDVERAEARDLGLRVLIGKRQAVVSSNELKRAHYGELAERAVAMARLAPEDPYCGLAEPSLVATRIPELDLNDPGEPSTEALAALAEEAEATALAQPRITNSEGAGASWGRSTVALATTGGFAGGYTASNHSVGCSVVASEGTAMERDYEFSSARYGHDLDSAREVGLEAARRAARRLNPRKVKSAKVPIVYEPRVARTLLGHFASAINGASIARGVSFLKSEMGKAVFAPGTRVIDDPHRKRGHASRPFDGEGVANAKMALVEDGVLQSWILDTASAAQLKLKSTGHAARGTTSPPSPSVTNLYLEPGPLAPEALLADIEEGFFVTELIGMGVNGVTGDYSRGAAGFWIEKGKLAYPVSEVTVAGNLKDMFKSLTPASDLKFRYGINAPTIRVEGMTVAGR
jgi:PmbA protein